MGPIHHLSGGITLIFLKALVRVLALHELLTSTRLDIRTSCTTPGIVDSDEFIAQDNILTRSLYVIRGNQESGVEGAVSARMSAVATGSLASFHTP